MAMGTWALLRKLKLVISVRSKYLRRVQTLLSLKHVETNTLNHSYVRTATSVPSNGGLIASLCKSCLVQVPTILMFHLPCSYMHDELCKSFFRRNRPKKSPQNPSVLSFFPLKKLIGYCLNQTGCYVGSLTTSIEEVSTAWSGTIHTHSWSPATLLIHEHF